MNNKKLAGEDTKNDNCTVCETHPLWGIRAIYFPLVVSNNLALASAHAVTKYFESQLGSKSHTAPP